MCSHTTSCTHIIIYTNFSPSFLRFFFENVFAETFLSFFFILFFGKFFDKTFQQNEIIIIPCCANMCESLCMYECIYVFLSKTPISLSFSFLSFCFSTKLYIPTQFLFYLSYREWKQSMWRNKK